MLFLGGVEIQASTGFGWGGGSFGGGFQPSGVDPDSLFSCLMELGWGVGWSWGS